MFRDDLEFDNDIDLDFGPLLRSSGSAEQTARMAEMWLELERQRHLAEGGIVDDIRTTRLDKMLSIANTLDRLNGEINSLILSAENDEGALVQLQNQVTHAGQRAGFIHDEYAKRLEVSHG